MNKNIFIAALLLVCGFSVTQSQAQKVLGSFIFKGESYNYEFAKEEAGVFTFHISKLGDPPPNDSLTYSFSEFSQQQVTGLFVNQMNKKYNVPKNEELNQKSIEIFFTIKARFDFLDDEPITAFLILKKDIIKSILKGNSSVFYDAALNNFILPHYIKRVSIETEDGAIKNITVQAIDTTKTAITVLSPRRYLEFKNQFPISISGKFDAEKLSKINLYCFNCNGIEGLSRYIKLSDLIILDIVLENDKEDYSPSNRTFSLTPSNPIVELKKEKRSRLLEVSAFTDFVGLDQEQPNGLIQIEAKRKININTKYHLFAGGDMKNENLAAQVDLGAIKSYTIDRKQNETIYDLQLFKQGGENLKYTIDTASFKQEKFTVKHRRFRSPFFNIFGSIEPRLLFSKLEDNNRFLDSSALSGNEINSLRLYQQQLASFGTSLQLLKFSFPQLKFTWNVLNTGIYWYRSRLSFSSDSTDRSSIPLNSHYAVIGTQVNFRPDSRWGATLGFDYINQSLWNSEYTLSDTHALHQIYFESFLRTDTYSKLFFRFKWTYVHKNRESNFTQIQMGYSLNLFGGGFKTVPE